MRIGGDAGTGVSSAERRAPVALRPARESDIEAVLAIEHASFGDPWNRSAFVDLLDDPRVAFLIADEGGAVRGYVVAWFVLDEGEIGNLAVASEARRHGIGARLLDGAIDAVRKADVDALYLEVRDSNAVRAGAVCDARLRRGSAEGATTTVARRRTRSCCGSILIPGART